MVELIRFKNDVVFKLVKYSCNQDWTTYLDVYNVIFNVNNGVSLSQILFYLNEFYYIRVSFTELRIFR